MYRELLNREKRGQTAHIYPKDISKIPVPVLEREKQLEMVNMIERIQRKINELENEVLEIVNFAKAKVEKILLGDVYEI